MADQQQARLVRIHSTKHLEVMQVSAAFAADVETNPKLERLSPWQPMEFDAKGDLQPFTSDT